MVEIYCNKSEGVIGKYDSGYEYSIRPDSILTLEDFQYLAELIKAKPADSWVYKRQPYDPDPNYDYSRYYWK